MVETRQDYRKSAQDDAYNMAEYFAEQIAEQIAESGKASDDINNDYPHGDSYHHENNVDHYYDLQEAAELLDQLSDYEETDSGLWEGQEPRKAIATQAAFTYGQAVWEMWSDVIKEINEAADADNWSNDGKAKAGAIQKKVESFIKEAR